MVPSDRRAHTTLVGGANVYPAEIESALMQHPSVLSAGVIGLPDEDLGNRVHAIVQITRPVDDLELATFSERSRVANCRGRPVHHRTHS